MRMLDRMYPRPPCFQPEALMSRRSRYCSSKAIRGVGLIEVMVAILVLAVGLLGIAALQATTLRNSQGALERSQAVIQTYGILDSMRANVVAARGGAYNMGMTCAAPAVSDLATSDLAAWIGQTVPIPTGLKGQLGPSACGMITSLGGGLFQITVQWNAERGVVVAPQQLVTVARI